MVDDLPQPSNPQVELPAEPTPTPPETPMSEPPASPEAAQDTETSELSPNLEAPQEPVSEPAEPVLGGLAPSEALPNEAQSSVITSLLAKARQAIFGRKQKKLEKILNFVALKKKVTNDGVEKLLRVSHATAFRYLNSLVKQGKLRQVGKTGQSVFYELIS